MNTRRYNNQHNSYARNGARYNRKPFVEDPDKAVFLSGFKENTPAYKWKDYREELYQAINKEYGVYITKFDLPSQSKFGYLHVKTAREAEKLLNLAPLSPKAGANRWSRDDSDNEEFDVDTPCMILAGHPVYVYEYKKTQKRKNEERVRTENRAQPWNSKIDTDHQDNGRSFIRDRSSNNLSAHSEMSTRDPSPYRRPMNVDRDSAMGTQQVSDDETPEKDSWAQSQQQMPMNNIEEVEKEVEITPTNVANTNTNNFTVNPLSDSANNSTNENINLGSTQSSVPTELTNTASVSTTGNNSFDDFTTALAQQEKFAQVLLEENWDPSFSTNLTDLEQINLMIMFMSEYKNKGAEAACQIFANIKTIAMCLDSNPVLHQVFAGIQV